MFLCRNLKKKLSLEPLLIWSTEVYFIAHNMYVCLLGLGWSGIDGNFE